MTQQPHDPQQAQRATLGRQIRGSIDHARSIVRKRMAAQGALAAAAALLAVATVGVLLFAAVPPYAILRFLVVAGALGASVYALVVMAARPYQDFKTLNACARWIEARLPEFRNDLSASLDFARDLDVIQRDGNTSLALVGRLLQQTRDRLNVKTTAVHEVLPQPRLKPALVTITACLVVLLGLRLAAPDAFQRGTSGLLSGASAQLNAKQATALDPERREGTLAADITLQYTFPAYAKRPPLKIFNSNGDIEALRGTEVAFEAIATRSVSRAELVLDAVDDGAGSDDADSTSATGPQRILLERRTDDRLVARFTLLRSGTYTIEATLPDGTTMEDGITRTMEALPDGLPNVVIVEPAEEVDVAPQDTVKITFEASDDMGLSELAIVTQLNGDPKDTKRVPIKSVEDAKKVLPGDARTKRTAPTGIASAPKTRLNLKDGPLDQAAIEALLNPKPRPSLLTPPPQDTWTEERGDTVLDLLPYKLQPKDRLVVYLEAVDNDTVSGPKVATSEPIVLRVASAEDKHLQLIADQEELFEALVLHLADLLEAPLGTAYTDAQGNATEGVPDTWDLDTLLQRYARAQSTHLSAAELLKTFSGLIDRMAQDPLSLKRDFDLLEQTRDDLKDRYDAEDDYMKAIATVVDQKRLRPAQMQGLFELRRLTVRTTEQSVLRLEDLIASQRMDSALQTAKDLQDAKDRLKELLQKYKDSKDPELKAEIMRQVQRLRQRMAEMMTRMQTQLKQLPTEHINMEALERNKLAEKANTMADSLSKLEEMLENGDIDAAMKALDDMETGLDDMLSQMESDFNEARPEGLSELDKEVSELMDEVNDLQAQEQQLAEETDRVAKELEEQQRKALAEKLDDFAKEQLDTLKDLQEQLKDIPADQLFSPDRDALNQALNKAEALRQALEQKDIAQALEQAEDLGDQLSQAQKDLLMRSGYMGRRDPRAKPYSQARDATRSAQPKADQIADDIRDLMEKAQSGASDSQRQKLQELAKRQGQARDRLQQLRERIGKNGDKFPMLKEQLNPGLGEADQFMEGAEKSLRRNQGRRAHGNEQMAFDKLGDLKQDLRNILKREKMGQQGRANSREDVVIPKDDDAPAAFREDLMEAMKEKGLNSYEKELQLYYESLAQ